MLGSSESALIKRSCRGDTKAFEALYRRHGEQIYGLVLRLTLDRAMAEDLTQEAFVRIWQQLPEFRFESALSTWMYAISSRVVLAHLRQLTRRHHLMPVESVDAVPDAAGGPDPAQQVGVERALAQLPERARQVLVLHDLAGLSHGEIAETLGMAPGTSKAQLSRARQLYRAMEDGDERAAG